MFSNRVWHMFYLYFFIRSSFQRVLLLSECSSACPRAFWQHWDLSMDFSWKTTHKTCAICWFENFDDFPVALPVVVFVDADGGDHDDESGRLLVLCVVYCYKSHPWKFHSPISKITTLCRLPRVAASTMELWTSPFFEYSTWKTLFLGLLFTTFQ